MYLRIAKTGVVRETPLGMYMGLPHNTRLEAFSTLLAIDESVQHVVMLCDGTRTREDILHHLADQSGEPQKEIEPDLDAFIEYMVAEGVLEWRETPSYIEPIYQGTRPYSLTLGVTFGCNLGCAFCSVEGGTPLADELTGDDIVPLIEQVKKVKPSPFGLSGGEPLLKKDLVLSILEEVCPVNDIYVNLFTNGTLITRDYAQQLYDAGLRSARISVDGHTDAVHDAMRGKGTFKKTIQGIKYLQELGITVEIVALICRTNYPYVKEIKEFVTQLGDSCIVGPINPMGRAVNSDLLLKAEERINTIFSNFSGEQIQTTVTPRDGCLAGLPLYIDPRGDMYPCFYLMLPEFKMGNVKENNLCEVYETELVNQLRGLTVADIEDCKDCHIRYFCGGSCRAAAYRCGGSLFVPDVLDCEYYKILADRILENGDEITKKALQELLESTNRM